LRKCRPRVETLIFAAKSRLLGVAGVALMCASAGCGSSTETSLSPSSLAKCKVAVTPGQLAVEGGGGTASMTVSAEAECAWTASAAASWISGLTPSSGQGNGEVKFQVAPNSASIPRQTDISLNNTIAKVTQAGAPCRIELAPRRQTVAVEGGDGTVTITTLIGCAWTVSSNASWLTASPAQGAGPGTVSFSAESNPGPARIGNLVIGGQSFVVTQQAVGDAQCTYALLPASVSIGAGGGSRTTTVRTGPGCSWTAASNEAWLVVGGSATGAGNGSLTINVSENTGAARTGTVTIAEQTFTVTQAGTAVGPGPGTCAYALQPATQSMSAAAGDTSVAVQTTSGCTWTATSNASWLTIGGTGSGIGSGVVTVTASANTGASRTGTATIAGQTFTVTQAGTCAASLDPSSASMPAAGGEGPPIAVTSADGCAWTATTSDTWLSINEGATGSGNGTVRFAAAQNSGAARTGALMIAGQTFMVTQAGACVSTIDPTSQAAPAAGGAAAPVAVTSPTGCDWAATTATSWLTITDGASGTGNGSVEFQVSENIGPARTGTLSIAGRTHTVNQASGCAVSIDPSGAGFSSLGGVGTPIAVSAAQGCPWTATKSADWITVTLGASGTGNGTVTYVVALNLGAAREGTIVIGTNTFTVSQEALLTLP
jgi:hypothetical protein